MRDNFIGYLEGIEIYHDDATVNTTNIGNFEVRTILVDIGSSHNCIFSYAFKQNMDKWEGTRQVGWSRRLVQWSKTLAISSISLYAILGESSR